MQALQIAPGKMVGRVLARLLERVLDDPNLNTREQLLRLSSEVVKDLSTGNSQ